MERVNILIKEAENHLKSWSWFHPDKEERAAECFESAAKVASHHKQNEKALELYNLALKCKISNFEKARIYEEKAILYNLDILNATEMEESYLKAIEQYEEGIHFDKILRLHKKLADYFYVSNKWEKAEKYLELVVEKETAYATRKGFLEKLFYSRIHLAKYKEAVETADEINNNLEAATYRWSITRILFKAALCLLVKDKIACSRKIENYRILDTNYDKNLYDLLQKMTVLTNVNDFTDLISEFNRRNNFDEIEQLLLLKVKETFNDVDSLC